MNCLENEVFGFLDSNSLTKSLTCSHPGVSSAPSPKRNLPKAGKSFTAIISIQSPGLVSPIYMLNIRSLAVLLWSLEVCFLSL